jgi:hypothetical protein
MILLSSYSPNQCTLGTPSKYVKSLTSALEHKVQFILIFQLWDRANLLFYLDSDDLVGRDIESLENLSETALPDFLFNLEFFVNEHYKLN